MIKVAAAVIKYEDKVLLMRRAPGQTNAGFWEFPCTKTENDERIVKALKRELDEELNISATIGKMITSVSGNEKEVFAYEVKYNDGLIRLPAHDNMEWAPLNEALSYNLLPEHKKIIMFMTKTKEEKQVSDSVDSIISKVIEKPVFDETTKKYVVRVKNPLFGMTRSFINQSMAMNFYMETVRYMIKSSQINRYRR